MAVLHWVSLFLCAHTALAAPHNSPQHSKKPGNPHGNYDAHPSPPPAPAPAPESPPAPAPSSPTVTIKNGTVEGVHSDAYNQDFFLGIPFAEPPVGANRFRAPQPLSKAWDTPLSAKQYSPACVGYGSDDWPYPKLSEDCLYLNIIRPSNYSDEKLPVAFWIHGGGLTQGSAIDERYNMTFMVQRSVEMGKPVMGVSVNYRLSMWGFVTGAEAVESGNANLGFRDQRAAMWWVKENIEAFGGDPTKVTIMGESAGALSVGMHLTAYNGRDDGLFRGAVMQSGNPINYRTFAGSDNNTAVETAAAAFFCPATSSHLDCLREVPFESLNSFINSTDGRRLSWGPIIDNDFIQKKTSIQLREGNFVHVPIIDGANSDEGTAFGPKPMNSTEQFTTYLTRGSQPVPLSPEQAQQVLDAYPSDISTYGLLVPANQPANWTPPATSGAESRRSDAYYGDVTFIASRRKTCQTWSSFALPAYCYRFNTIPHGLPPAIGATHFQEVAFVFDNTAGLGYGYPGVSQNPFEGMPQSYYDLAAMMSGAWVSFVAEGNPGEWWPSYEGGFEGVGKDWVFDANVTGLGYAEDDDWRKEGIELINSWDEDVYQR